MRKMIKKILRVVYRNSMEFYSKSGYSVAYFDFDRRCITIGCNTFLEIDLFNIEKIIHSNVLEAKYKGKATYELVIKPYGIYVPVIGTACIMSCESALKIINRYELLK